jgi:acylphosphatase
MKCFQITVFGKVTHKGFRFGAMQMAYKLGISGFVQYKKHDCILIEAEGKKKKLKKFIEWCRSGPIWAKVEDINVKEIEIKGHKSFNILHVKHQKSESLEQTELSRQTIKKKSILDNVLTILELDEKKHRKRSAIENANPNNLMIGGSSIN